MRVEGVLLRAEGAVSHSAPTPLWRCADRSCSPTGCGDEEVLQRSATAGRPGHVPATVFEVLASPGSSLPAGLRAAMEGSFGHDFSGVRVHTDIGAAESARAVHARAYSVGSHMVFAAGRYQPATPQGRLLLAHELAHVARSGPMSRGARSLRISSPSDSSERDADRAAENAVSGSAVHTAAKETDPVLHRTWDPPAAGDCPARDPASLEKVVVDQEKSQSVTLHWSDGTVSASICSTGKGHCCVTDATLDGTAGSVSESRRNGSNLTPITAGAGYTITDRYQSYNGWRFWNMFDPTRGIGLHQHHTVTGTPLSHGCVRLPLETAQEIFCGARQRQTRVEVRGFSRPDCDEDNLQREWQQDFTSAAATPSDGEAPDVTRIRLQNRRESRRILREAYGRDLSESEIARGERGALAIPRCGFRGAEPTSEERRAVPSVGAAANVPSTASETVAAAGLEPFVPALSGALGRAGGLGAARSEVSRIGRQLWQVATGAARAGHTDDRPLYWARLQMTRTIRQWEPRFRLSDADRRALVEQFERASRGMETATLSGPSDRKRIVISGFDPFGFDIAQYGLTRATNPSGAAALALDGRTLTNGAIQGVVESVIFPVSFAAFDAGSVEQFFGTYLRGRRPADMIMTISMGAPGADFEVEEFAGRRRGGGLTDNPDVTQAVPGVPAGLGPGPEFIRGTLPPSTRRALGRTGPTRGETEVKEIPAGGSSVVSRPSGPTSGSTSVEGSGGSFLSNEIFYRVGRLQLEQGTSIPFGHLHVPFLSANATNVERMRSDITRRVWDILTAVLPDL
jgi:pyrrolidone-carboxylate peptidase